jgi:cellulose synthase/poly-beta-1,6-N-acetylglucosamine synthase-like glycosyltransferase
MVTFISYALATLASFLAILVAVFSAEVLAAIALPSRDRLTSATSQSRPRVAVLIPAHNESIGLLPTLRDVQAQMQSVDRVLVVADNCTDDTAVVAAATGADVVERNDTRRRGKGYALAWGLRHLAADPPDVVVIIDADCRLASAAIDRLTRACAAKHRPMQALYLMTSPKESAINSRVAEFAWRVKNWVRPLGLSALGLPCQLMGTGMAIPWNLTRSVDLASGSIVEDLKLGHDLALAGSSPAFCSAATVTSAFASSIEGLQSQRRRWEQGHIGMILAAAPRLITVAVTQRDLNLFALALDVAVPPLSLLAMLIVAMSLVAGLGTLIGSSSAALLVSTASLLLFVVSVFISWLKWGRDILPPSSIPLIASYVLGKIPLYWRILNSKSAAQWIRTDRRKS